MVQQDTILIVDDEPDLVNGLRRALSLDSYRVETAGTIGEILNRSAWSHILAILLDRKLPDGYAEDVLPQLVALAPDSAVIIVTGYADLDSTIAALRNGATDYLLKPVNPHAMRACLSRLSQLKQAERRAMQAERLAAVGEMVAVLAHETRNYLQRIQMHVELLRFGLRDQPEALKSLGHIEGANDAVCQLLEEVRHYTAPIQLNRECCDLQTIWRMVWADLAPIREGRDVEFLETAVGVNLQCAVDAQRLHQVFRNLLENSLAATCDPVRIEMRCCEETMRGNAALCVSIRDNGPGLTEEQQQKVFDAFYTTKSSGTGLGLAIVRRIVEAHGGQIALGAASTGGAEFVITLPRQETQSLSEKSEPEFPAEARKSV